MVTHTYVNIELSEAKELADLHGIVRDFETAKQFKNLDFIDFGSGFKVPYKQGDIETNIEELGKKLSKRSPSFMETSL